MYYILFLIIHSFIDSTNQSVVSNYYFDNNLNINRTCFYKKQLQLYLTFYK